MSTRTVSGQTTKVAQSVPPAMAAAPRAVSYSGLVAWYVRKDQRRPDPPALRTDDRTPVLIGTSVWALLAVVCGFFHATLSAGGHLWWLWACLSGTGLGLFGLWYVHAREMKMRQAEGVDPAVVSPWTHTRTRQNLHHDDESDAGPS